MSRPSRSSLGVVAIASALLAGCRTDAGTSGATQSTETAIEVVGPPKSAADLAWMSGTWTAHEGDTIQEERWSTPLGGILLGTGRTVIGGRARFFEYLRIEERDGGLVYVASPLGRGTTDFRLTDGGARRARFENPAHDWPTSIEYELRADGQLTARVSGPGKTEEYVWSRTP